MLALLLATLKIGEIIGDCVLLPVTIRGEVPGRAMRGGANLGLKAAAGASIPR